MQTRTPIQNGDTSALNITPTRKRWMVVNAIRNITNYVAANLTKFDADDDWVPTRINAVRKHIPESDASSV